MILSKSNYLLYLKHPAWLWLEKHEKDKLPEVDDDTQAIFDAGNLFEEYAEQLFPGALKLGYKTEVGAFDFAKYQALPELTKDALMGEHTVLLQGRVEVDGLTCIFDVLERTAMGTFNLYEIKSSTEAKPEHEHDLAFQTLVLEKAELTIENVYVIHVNTAYVRRGGIDPQEITDTTEVTSAVRSRLAETSVEVEKAKAVLAMLEMPDPSPRFARNGAFREWLYIYEELFVTDHEDSIYTVPAFGARKIGELEDLGITKISQIPDELSLSPKLTALVQAARSNTRLINHEAIQTFVNRVVYPIYFLDYETFSSVIPPFDGTRPYQQIPFQYSLHVLESPTAELVHKEFLHTEATLPVRALLEQMTRDIGPDGTVLVWHKSFEMGRNMLMAEMEPDFNAFLYNLNDRIIDLKEPFSEQWFVDRGFRASASIKDVLPVLVPELSYKDLNVRGGATAQRIWMQTVFDGKHPEQKAEIMEDLRKYCERDTLAMVKIWEVLRNT